MNIPEMLVNRIDVFIVLKRYHANGRMFRVIDEISETGGMEHNKILLSQVFKYNYDNHEFVARAPSTVYRDSLAREAGLKPRYIIYETLMRTLCLKEMIKRDVHTMKEVTTFCRAYKENPEKAMAGLGLDREGLLKELNKDEV
jgi:hypothetical protein